MTNTSLMGEYEPDYIARYTVSEGRKSGSQKRYKNIYCGRPVADALDTEDGDVVFAKPVEKGDEVEVDGVLLVAEKDL